MATAQQVTDALQELLPTIDTNTATERKIREQLAEKLGDINEHKKLIKGIIDDFLTEQLTQSQADSDPQPPSSKRQRTARSADAAVAAAETPSAGSTEGAPEGGVMLDTQGLKWASVSTFKGQQYINIRNYFRAKDTGALGPTKKGISLNPGLWSTLQTALPQLQQAVSDGNEDFAVQLSSTVKATISTYGGKLQLDIREYYEDGGELKPGMKGIALLPQQFDSLVEAVPTLNQQLSSKSAPAAAAAAGLGASKPTAAAAPAAGVKARGGSSSSAGNGPVIELGGRKRVTISSFGGGGVDLRETYEKDGQTMPGKKGILLKYAQWEAVCAAAEHITKALEMRNMKYKLDLGNKRTVQLSEFKNQYYVAIREYYEKDGKMLPGQKGLNLKGDEWYKLADGMAQINEHIK